MNKYLLQTVLFPKSKFSTFQCNNWLIDHGYENNGVDIKKNFYRYRQIDPVLLKINGYTEYINRPLINGIELVFAYKKK